MQDSAGIRLPGKVLVKKETEGDDASSADHVSVNDKNLCVRTCSWIENKMQDSASIHLPGKVLVKKETEGDDASSADHVSVNDKNLCVRTCSWIENKMQDSAGIDLPGKVMVKKEMEEDDASSAADVSVNDKKKLRRKEKAVATSKSSSVKINEQSRMYFCSSCPRKFISQHAMAGHRNIHRNEWESKPPQDVPSARRNMQPHQVQFGPIEPIPSPYPTFALKQQSIGSSRSTLNNASSIILRKHSSANPISILKGPYTWVPRHPLANPANTLLKVPTPRDHLSSTPTYPLNRHTLFSPSNTLKGTSSRDLLGNPTMILKKPSPAMRLLTSHTNALKESSLRYPLANPTNTLISPLVPASRYLLANPTNTLIGPSSLGAPHRSFFCSTSTLNYRPSVPDLNLPVDNLERPHGKSALGVRRESMIHKPCQFRQLGQTDMWLRAGSRLYGRQQMMGGYIRGFVTNNNNVHIRSLSTAAGFAFSRTEVGGSSEAHGVLSCFPESSAPTQAQERHNYGLSHSSPGPVRQPDNDGEDETTLDVDLELKL